MTVATPSRTSCGSSPMPRFGTPRTDRPTHGAKLAVIAEALGTPLMPWQRHVADVALEFDPLTGRLVHRRVLLTVPRQSGKTTLLLALFMWRAVALGGPQSMVFTAQNALDARMRLQREWHRTLQASPLASSYTPSWKTGAEALLFNNGGKLQVVASTEKSGHGHTLDLAVVDEAFAQPDSRLEQALSPTMLTRPEPQLWYVSTAGSPADKWFRSKVKQGRELSHSPDAGTAFFEWSAPDDADPMDREVWRDCMPALGRTVSEQVIASESVSLAPDEFRRAYLNQWVDRGSDGAFDAAVWAALADPTAERGAAPAFGLAVAPDRSWATIAVAWRRPDGLPQVMLAENREGTAWVAARVAELQARWGGTVLADTAGRGLVPDATEPGTQAQAQAHNALATAVEGGLLRHGNEPALNFAVKAARWKPSGDSRVLDRKGSSDISPLVAAALALHGLQNAPTSGGWMVSL